MRRLGILILAIFLLLFGLSELISLGALRVLVPILAIVAAVVLLLGR